MTRGPKRGPLREQLCKAITEHPGTAREIAARTCIGYPTVKDMLQNMVAAGDAKRLSPVRVPGVNRPVPVYGGTESSEDVKAQAERRATQRLWAAWWPDQARQLEGDEHGED